MTTSQEHEESGHDPKQWSVSAVKWVFENPDYRYEILTGIKIKGPAQELESSKTIESVEAPDLEAAVAAAHALLDKHAREAGDPGFEIWLTPPKHPYPGQEALGVPHYRLGAEARKQARAVGIRGGDLEARVARMVRHAAPLRPPDRQPEIPGHHHAGGGRYRDLDRPRDSATASPQGQVTGRAGGHPRSAGSDSVLEPSIIGGDLGERQVIDLKPRWKSGDTSMIRPATCWLMLPM
jgi:hypothetical protein